LGYTGGSTSTTTKNLPKWATQYGKDFLSVGEQALSDASSSTGTALKEQSAGVLSQELSGTVDPTLQATINSQNAITQQQASQQLGTDVNKMFGQANQAGALYSSGASAAGADAAQKMATNVAGITDARQASAQTDALNRQASAVSQGQQWNQQSLNEALQIANMLKGSSSSLSSNNYQVGTS
jgi:hypothetical protein